VNALSTSDIDTWDVFLCLF